MVRQSAGRQLVIAFFASPAAGEVAARSLGRLAGLQQSGGTIGLLMRDRNGQIVAGKLGGRTAGEVPGVGAVLGVIALALGGGAVPSEGHLFDARSDLSTDDVARFGAELDAGQAAVAVLEHPADADRAVVELTGLGGKVEVHWLTRRALSQAATAPPAG